MSDSIPPAMKSGKSLFLEATGPIFRTRMIATEIRMF
jgi:hypothetical protein